MCLYGNEQSIETNALLLKCGDSDVKIVTTAIQEMSERNLLPGHARFSSFNVHKIGEVKYINMIKHHNRHGNKTQILSIADITTPDLETFLMQNIEGTTLSQIFF